MSTENIKKRKISQKDWDVVAGKIRDELKSRQNQKFRKTHELIWKEVDRQLAMEPMKRFAKDGKKIDPEWRSVLELGELAKASEIIAADVMRLTFPTTRSWFEVHSEIPAVLDDTGTKQVDAKAQDFIDRAYRALLVQQHLDFGLKARYELSVKESLHHGSYVTEIRWENRIRLHGGTGVEQVSAPIWVPYSMWNSYPDPSPSVIGTDLFYTGSMILVDYLPLYLLKNMAQGEGWMLENLNRIKKKTNQNKDVETEDVELIKYYGDLEIERGDGNILLPNSKVILANDVIVYFAPNDLASPSIIYSGYERVDVRDPYYTSPLIKLSPMQKLGSQMANKLIDSMAMRVEPPIAYDANDPQLVLDGGPRMAPGAKIGVKGSYGVKEIQAGDPQAAMVGLEFIIAQLNQGLGINAIRSGAGDDRTDKTATEITTSDVKAEIRTAEFVDKQERHALRPFLYMQHELNKKYLQNYTFYNPEMDAPDFMQVTAEDIPVNVVFDVVGSRGALGERARAQRVGEVTAFLLSNPMTQKLPNVVELAKQAYQDAGVKNPERFLNLDQGLPQEAMMIAQEAEQMIQQAQQRIGELEKELAITKAVNEAKVMEAQMRAETQINITEFKTQLEGELSVLKAQLEVAKSAGSQQGPAISISEINSIVGSLDKILSISEKQTSEVDNKLSEMNKTVSSLVNHMSRPIKVKVTRDANGKLAEATGARE